MTPLYILLTVLIFGYMTMQLRATWVNQAESGSGALGNLLLAAIAAALGSAVVQGLLLPSLGY